MTRSAATPPLDTTLTTEHPSARVAREVAAGDVLTASQAARRRPAHRGKRGWGSTTWRHIVYGVKRWDGQIIRLEAVRVGRKWVTSEAALIRFWAALTPNFSSTPQTLEPAPSRPQDAGDKSDAVLRKWGY